MCENLKDGLGPRYLVGPICIFVCFLANSLCPALGLAAIFHRFVGWVAWFKNSYMWLLKQQPVRVCKSWKCWGFKSACKPTSPQSAFSVKLAPAAETVRWLVWLVASRQVEALRTCWALYYIRLLARRPYSSFCLSLSAATLHFLTVLHGCSITVVVLYYWRVLPSQKQCESKGQKS